MHHKRGKPKNSRSGCLLCKPHKMNHAKGKDTISTIRRKSVPDHISRGVDFLNWLNRGHNAKELGHAEKESGSNS